MESIRELYASSDDSDVEESRRDRNVGDSSGVDVRSRKGEETSYADPSSMRSRVMETCLTSAPHVIPYDTTTTALSLSTTGKTTDEGRGGDNLIHNWKAKDLFAPMIGPKNPHRTERLVQADGKTTAISATATAVEHNVNEFTFSDAFHKRRLDGYANPHPSLFLGKEADKTKNDPRETSSTKRRKLNKEERAAKREAARKRMLEGAVNGVYGSIWAPQEDLTPKTDAEAGTLTAAQKVRRGEKVSTEVAKRRTEEQEKDDADRAEAFKYTRGEGPSVRWTKSLSAKEAKSVFHGDAETDYQGRSWDTPPSRLKPVVDPADHKALVPKKCVHTYRGHKKVVRKIELFPSYGHLLLSGSFDSTVKIWDVYNKRTCMRTYMGHSEGVNDVQFSNDGDCFISSSLDRHIKLWDTETGKCRIDMSNNKVPYCARFYPKNNNLVLVGSSNKKIVQFDCRTGDVVQEYNHHLGPVNSVTFIDDARRFVSTSDDKKMLIWDFDIPVPIKTISDPTMHSIPTVTERPGGAYYAGQSMDNQILTYKSGRRICPNKKRFTGHVVAGYACQVNFSPNGQFIMSGDGDGRLWIWNWKSSKVVRKINAHKDGPCIGCVWHPIDHSRVITAGWDGRIKMFE